MRLAVESTRNKKQNWEIYLVPWWEIVQLTGENVKLSKIYCANLKYTYTKLNQKNRNGLLTFINVKKRGKYCISY